MRLACSRRADSSFLVAGSLPMAEGSLRAAPKSLFRNTYRSTALNHTTSLWVWNFPQSNLGDKTQTRHTAGPMEKKPQRERIAFRRPGPNSRASPAAPSPAAGSRRSSLRPHPQHALRHSPPLRPHPRAPQHPRKAVAQRLPPRALSSASPSAPSRQRSAAANPRNARFFRIPKSLLLYYGRVLK